MIENATDSKLCACGCGELVKGSRPYFYGHKMKVFENHLCECGCGEFTASYKRFKIDHNGRGKHHKEETLLKMRKPKSVQGRLNIKAGANKPEVRANRSRLTKIQGADPIIKAKLLETNAKPEIKAKKSAIQKIVQNLPVVKLKIAETNAKPEVKERRSKAVKKFAKKAQNRPEVKAKQSVIQKIVQKEVQNRPEVIAKKAITNVKSEVHERRVQSAIDSCAKPEVRAKRLGSNNGNWHEGISFGEYEPGFNNDLKRDIKERDGFHCRNCLTYSARLDIHHIDFDKKNSSSDNLITLCRSCHGKTNGKNRVYWIDFYQAKMIPLSELDRFNQIEREALCA